MKTLLTAAAVLAVAGFALNASAETSTATPSTAPAATQVKPTVPANVAAPTSAPTSATKTVATGAPATTTTTTGATTTPSTFPAATTAQFTGQITSVNPDSCKIGDKTFMFATEALKVASKNWKVGDKVTATYDTKTWTLLDVKPAVMK